MIVGCYIVITIRKRYLFHFKSLLTKTSIPLDGTFNQKF